MISQGSLVNLKIDFNLEAQFIEAQKEDKGMKHLKEKISNKAPTDFKVDDVGDLVQEPVSGSKGT